MNSITRQFPPKDCPRPDLPGCRIYPQQVLRAAALADQIRDQNLASDRVLQHAFREERKLGKRDRQILQTLVFFVLRHWRLLDHLLDRRDAPALARLGMALRCAERLDERLSELTGVSRETVIRLDTDAPNERYRLDAIGTRFSLRDEDAERLVAAFGDEAESVGAALLDRAPINLRINPGKSTRADVLASLASKGIQGTPIDGLPLGVRVAGSPALTTLPAFTAGEFEIQDAGSQWIIAACQAAAGQSVLDLCAGAGGKALGLAQDVGETGRVFACDVDETRLARLPERGRRAGIHNIECQPVTSGTDPVLLRHAPFDRVLIDAPCSGSGTFRRHPELKQASIDMTELCTVQRQLLDEGAALTRPGGLLIYATCSLWREENETQITSFLTRHPDWRIQPLPMLISDHVQHRNDMARLRPDIHGSDGFFFTVLQAPHA